MLGQFFGRRHAKRQGKPRSVRPQRRPRFESLERREVPAAAQYVIHVSVDALRSDAVTILGSAGAPNFFRLRNEGSFTDNARTDSDKTETIPNHTTQLTGRPVTGSGGHAVTFNIDNGATVHATKGSYVASIFDVVHDQGFATALFASKSKFAFFDRSWDASNGALDTTGPDNGRDKIDRYLFLSDTTALVDQFATEMAASKWNYALLHFRDPDSAGHANGWLSTTYFDAVRLVDAQLGELFSLVENTPALAGRTALIVTADHGGEGPTHVDSAVRENFTIPFYVWGPGVTAEGELYAMNLATRTFPGLQQPGNAAAPQPIRNGDAANLAANLLGLPSIAGSQFNVAQDLNLVSDDTRWLRRLYSDKLGRVGSDAEIGYWGRLLHAGWPRGTINATMERSIEFRSRGIDLLYQQYLARPVDSSGRGFWLNVTAGSDALDNVRLALLASHEYFLRKGGTHTGYVEGLYTDLLGRTPQPAETSYWTSVLGQGTPRSTVTASFLVSAEFRVRTIQQAYLDLLGRPADSAGTAFWLAYFNSGATVGSLLSRLLASDEYYALI